MRRRRQRVPLIVALFALFVYGITYQSDKPKKANRPDSEPQLPDAIEVTADNPATPEAPAPNAKTLTGRVTAVTDGDTIKVLVTDAAGTKEVKVRLNGIDAPEKSQAFGQKSKAALSEKVFGKKVRVEVSTVDRYGRTVGTVYADELNVNLAMVAEGFAWHYKAYSKDKALADAETKARSAKTGLWADGHPVAPWEFRRKK